VNNWRKAAEFARVVAEATSEKHTLWRISAVLDARLSGCINHPSIEAEARCRQCGRPVCGKCVVTGPTGMFCSDNCKQRHEDFYRRAQELDTRPPSTLGAKFRWLLNWLVVVVAVIAAVVGVAAVLPIPVLSDWVFYLRGYIHW
jgi:hypothetical protein